MKMFWELLITMVWLFFALIALAFWTATTIFLIWMF